MITNINWAPWLAVLQIGFALLGLAFGWIPNDAAYALIGTGLATFSVHDSAVKAGRAGRVLGRLR